jgi:hypothetical protein
MFTWLNKQGVESDRGFTVQFTGRFTAEYREDGKVITLALEDGVSGGVPAVIIGPNAFDCWDNDRQKIDLDQKDRLFRNLKEAIEFQGLKLVVE